MFITIHLFLHHYSPVSNTRLAAVKNLCCDVSDSSLVTLSVVNQLTVSQHESLSNTVDCV